MDIELRSTREIIERDGDETAVIELTAPVFTDDPAGKRLRKYYERAVKTFSDWVRSLPSPLPDPIIVKYEITHNDGNLISLYRDITIGRISVRIADTWLNGYPVTLKKLGMGKRKLISECCEEAETLNRSGYISLLNDHKKRIKQKFDPSNFYIKSGKLIVFYNPGSVAKKSRGVIQFMLNDKPLTGLTS